MSFKVFVAWRYLRGAQGSKSGTRYLRFISGVAIVSVSLGVAALLLALSIVRGFSQEIETKITGFGAHVQVENILRAPLERTSELMASVKENRSVISAHPVVSELVLLRRSRRDIEGVGLWGTDHLPVYLQESLIGGFGELDPTNGARLVIGSSLAEDLNLEIGEKVTLLSTRNFTNAEALLTTRPRLKQFEITGIYETALIDFDQTHVFTDIATARQLLDYAEDEVTRIDVMLEDVSAAPSMARHFEESLGTAVMARSIFDIYRGIFAWVNLQEAIIPLVIGVLILVAAFNVMGTLLMIVLEKTREIGILASMGASQRDIRRLYLYLGFFCRRDWNGDRVDHCLGACHSAVELWIYWFTRRSLLHGYCAHFHACE